jgi:hypothetical protein
VWDAASDAAFVTKAKKEGRFFSRGGRRHADGLPCCYMIERFTLWSLLGSRFGSLDVYVRYGTVRIFAQWLALGDFPREKLLEYGMPNTANEYKTVTCASLARRLARAVPWLT